MEPLILTLRMDDLSQQGFNRLREEHFPKARNFIPAHLTLFHKLPGDRGREISQALKDLCHRQAPFSPTATGLIFMGRGVGYRLESPALQSVRKRLADEWGPWLGPQDRQGFRPHVTVQNKVTPEAARELLARLSADWQPIVARGTGLDLWRYRGGPWGAAGTFRCDGAEENISEAVPQIDLPTPLSPCVKNGRLLQ